MNAKWKTLLIASAGITLLLNACGERIAAIPSTATATLTPANTPTPNITPIPTLGVGSTWTRPVDGMVMVYVPEGEFSMGMDADASMEICNQFSDDCNRDLYLAEEPVHIVFLDAYWIDRTEVTNAMYALCVSAGACQPPTATSNKIPPMRYGDAEFADYPITNVDSAWAETYCAWTGARLPTEAEWEKAARGTDGRIYPWGDSAPDCSLLNSAPNFTPCVGDTTQVGSYPSGASPYGALDMAGNVYEWVSDWHSEDYYSQSPARNPAGPASGEMRVVRGGSWNLNDLGIRSSHRQVIHPWGIAVTVGFRCARSISP